ncbi:MAG TPA: hypothetical protein DDY78_25390 [Planctomycetales bacterium]|nr:hypothetical protein [Planctomycetales bacterium]
MFRITMIVCAVLFASIAWAQPSPVPVKKPATPEALKAEIEALRDAKVAWRKVEWRTCLLDALKESARDKKPVFLWVLGGAPADGRC